MIEVRDAVTINVAPGVLWQWVESMPTTTSCGIRTPGCTVGPGWRPLDTGSGDGGARACSTARRTDFG